MAFLSDTKNFGILAMIAAAISIVGAVLSLFNSSGVYSIVCGIGAIVGGIVLLLASVAIFTRSIPPMISSLFPEGARSKFGVLVGYTAAVGVASILKLTPVGIIVGAIILVVVWVLTNDRKGVVEKILWFVLAVLYFLGAILGILTVFGGGALAIVSGICAALMYLLAFVYLFDSDVKKKFNL